MSAEPFVLWPTQFALFDSRKDYVQIHRLECRMGRLTNPRASVTSLFKQWEVEDLIARGYGVRHCKCCEKV